MEIRGVDGPGARRWFTRLWAVQLRAVLGSPTCAWVHLGKTLNHTLKLRLPRARVGSPWPRFSVCAGEQALPRARGFTVDGLVGSQVVFGSPTRAWVHRSSPVRSGSVTRLSHARVGSPDGYRPPSEEIPTLPRARGFTELPAVQGHCGHGSPTRGWVHRLKKLPGGRQCRLSHARVGSPLCSALRRRSTPQSAFRAACRPAEIWHQRNHDPVAGTASDPGPNSRDLSLLGRCTLLAGVMPSQDRTRPRTPEPSPGGPR
jgi:hypothetical protein